MWLHLPTLTRFLKTQANRCVDCGFLGISTSAPRPISPYSSDGEWLEWLQFWNKIAEFTFIGRKHILNSQYSEPELLRCKRNLWPLDIHSMPHPEQLSFMLQKRKCKYFFPYSPGLNPDDHFQLQREHRTNILLWKVGITSAVIGAAAAIVAGYLT